MNSQIFNVQDLIGAVQKYSNLERRIIFLRKYITGNVSGLLQTDLVRQELDKIEPEFLRLHETLHNLLRVKQ